MRKALDSDFRLINSIKLEYEKVIEDLSKHKETRAILYHYSEKHQMKERTAKALAQSL